MKLVKCPHCNGKGSCDVYSDTFKITYPVNCTYCNKTGKVPKTMTYIGMRKK